MQNQYLTVTFYSYENVKIPREFEGYRIVQISDLHNASFGKDNQRLIKKIKNLEPDMIVITGDVVDSNHTDVEVAVSFAKQAVNICPTYYVTGNHENWLDSEEKESLLRALRDADVVCLADESLEITRGENSILLIGLNDESLGNIVLSRLSADANDSRLQVLLAHEPQYFDNYCTNGVDLVLSGHAHGGQFRLPFVGGLVAPGQGLFPPYTEGMHVDGETTMIISRGLGNSIIPIRLFNLPEIVCVDF